MTYKQEMKFIATQIVKSKGHHVYLKWSRKKKDVFDLVGSLNSKINKAPGVNKVETTVEPLFVQQQFDFDDILDILDDEDCFIDIYEREGY